VVYNGFVRERRQDMEKCVQCFCVMQKYEVFPGQICVACYAKEFEKEFQAALKIERFK
jgi:hypothetical protein